MTLELMKTTDAFDRALAEFIIPLVEASRQVYELSALTAELGVHQHVVLKMRQLIGNVLLDRLALFNLPDFGRAQPALRDKTLSELLRQLFRQILEPEESTPRELPEPPQEKKPEAAEEPADEDILEIPAGFSLLEEATT